jgi:hypothetical protein
MPDGDARVTEAVGSVVNSDPDRSPLRTAVPYPGCGVPPAWNRPPPLSDELKRDARPAARHAAASYLAARTRLPVQSHNCSFAI